ncbi:hypothetical protein VCRA2126O85_50191 [Vibrio crassostreae]|nr:hypothetical protein VCRA2126O86_50191 [Vibrio crassostreae]CAK3041712.1 hypothetical protein VCRA2125O83_50192 [Vibrio crassostreae]CAK3042267.1 hypothetical protein VCRA2128O106_50191 [Vibrio crassostreae]CAK3044534.1 hypothetical protein VCRA2126O85_50191 [Vibrio crassostreae]CAK3044631.1 hypothetical protein VCRA2127O91_50192 [Vibrio crassostreae]
MCQSLKHRVRTAVILLRSVLRGYASTIKNSNINLIVFDIDDSNPTKAMSHKMKT